MDEKKQDETLVNECDEMEEEAVDEEAPAEPEPSAEEKLLTEIRDLLKERK